MSKIKIGIDIDDVCWDLVDKWLEYYYNLTNDYISKNNIKTWNIRECVENETILFSILNRPEFWLGMLKPDDTTYFAIRELYHDYDVYFITSTSYKTPREKLDKFLQYYSFVDPNKLIMTTYKSLVNVDLLIDDNADTIDKCDEKGMETILFAQPWNKYGEANFIRTDDWGKIKSRAMMLQAKKDMGLL